jgi:hypothetical protein
MVIYHRVIGFSFSPTYCHGSQGSHPNSEKDLMPVIYYASDDERDRLIGGLRALAQFLQDRPDIPAPRWTGVLVFPPDGPDEGQRAEIDVIASRIGAGTDESARGHYSCSISFGPVEYRAVAIPADENKEQ